jgi:predicted aldo/keto reductase-like oxidoreductase
MSIPLREFGRTGHHLGGAKDEKTAIEIAHRALHHCINIFDNAWEIHKGLSEEKLGIALDQMQALRNHDKQFNDGRGAMTPFIP